MPALWIVPDDATGQPHADKSIWICRREPEGWRVAALAAYVYEGEDPMFLNFEKPEEMAKQQEWLKREETDRRLKEETAPPAGKESSSQAEQKPQDAFRR